MRVLQHLGHDALVSRVALDRLAQLRGYFFLDGPQLLKTHHCSEPPPGKGPLVRIPFRFHSTPAPRHAMTDASQGDQEIAAARPDWVLRLERAGRLGNAGVDNQARGADPSFAHWANIRFSAASRYLFWTSSSRSSKSSGQFPNRPASS